MIDLQLARLPSSLASPAIVTPADSHGGGNQAPKTVELPPTPPDVAGHRAAMTQALGEGFVTSCQKNLSAAQLKCALAASDSVSVTECETSPSK